MERPTLVHRRRTTLLAATGMALVFAALPDRAAAQAFQGNGVVPSGAGGATITTGVGSTTVNVTGPRTVINWTPTDTTGPATIDFLPNGTTATFRSDLTDYTVLNRILPTTVSAIGLNGTIQSTVSDGSTGQVTGGNLWFYTPYGFVIGANATINVGGLILTTKDVLYSLDAASGQANFLDANGAINFRGTAGSTSSIVNNAQTLTGVSASNYIAFVAPRIEQAGKVQANRSIAYVAGEEVDLRINAGQFDITVLTGTTDAEGIVHTGTTTGSASTGFFDSKTISMVAIPKNDALTMMLSGDIGYTAASGAVFDGSAIVLQAGDGSSPDGNIALGNNTSFANRLDANATGTISGATFGSLLFDAPLGKIAFGNTAFLYGDKGVSLTAGAGGSITAANSLYLYSRGNGGTGGSVTLEALPAGLGAPAGAITVTGSLSLDASAYGTTSSDGTVGSDATGGAVRILANGGTISADSIYADANGQGGYGSVAAGDGYGGTVDILAGYGGSVTAGYLSLYARGAGGYGSFDQVGGEGIPGDGHGGRITLADAGTALGDDTVGGALDFSGLYLNATADGGYTYSGLNGGNAFGGQIDLTIGKQDQTWDYFFANVGAYDGSGSFDPVGGTMNMTVTGGTNLLITGDLSIYADAVAGVNGADGAFAKGGAINLTVDQGSSLISNGSLYLSSRADSGYFFGIPDTTADLTGGDVTVIADSGLIEGQFVTIDVGANNLGATTRAGFAHGGTVSVTASNGGSFGTGVQTGEGTPEFRILAEAYSSAGDVVGESRGGSITLAALSGGAIVAPGIGIVLDASGETGVVNSGGANGAPAFGGSVAIDAIGGSIGAPVTAYANGLGGEADFAAGDGTGGTIGLRVLQGGSFASSLGAYANGIGGQSFVTGDGGDGTGGRFTMLTDDTASLPAFSLEYQGYGQGGAATDGAGGDAVGGSAQVDILGGKQTWSAATLATYAQSGYGPIGGSATGGAAGTNFHVGNGASLTIRNDLFLDVRAYAGVNGGANAATGGTIGLTVDGGATLTAGSVYAEAWASILGGEIDPFATDTSPTARGGTITISADGGTLSAPYIEAYAYGDTSGALTSAGEAHGGTVTVEAANGGAVRIEGLSEDIGLYLSANGFGGEGPSAANAFGGSATLRTAGGTIGSPVGLDVQASGLAGSYSGAFEFSGIDLHGFDARGGTARAEMVAGTSGTGSIDAPYLSVTASGRADDGVRVNGDAGDGFGGTATLAVAEGTLTVGSLTVEATGSGGRASENLSGGATYASGNGTGGTATFALSGGAVTTPDVSVTADGLGGAGYGSTSGATQSTAGDGFGGSATFSASGGSITGPGVDNLFEVRAAGVGGFGAYNPDLGPGGAAGDGNGGTALFEAPAGSTALLDILAPIGVRADGYGGFGGASADLQAGTGGDGFGGTANMALADIAFGFGPVTISGSGFGGLAGFVISDGAPITLTGGTVGIGNGGSAGFALEDSTTTSVARTIESLDVLARGTDSTGNSSGAGGATTFLAEVGGAGAALAITGNLVLDSTGATAPVGYGFSGTISGAPVTVGGTATIATPRDAILTITDPGALAVTGDLTIAVGRTFTSTGAIATLANASVVAPGGISMTDLSAGGTTLLQATSGPVVVSHDLRSGGLVTVLGTTVDLVSLGALSFADADATAGDLSIETVGNLDLVTVDATGAVTLTSSTGTIHNTGAVNGTNLTFVAGGDVVSDTMLSANGNLTVDAGGRFLTPTGSASATGNVSLSADVGLDLATVVSGGTTLLRADAGTVAVDSLTSPGAVTASGQSVTIGSPGALTFASATATASDLTLTTAGNLTLATGSASGAIALTSSGGSIGGTGPITSGGAFSADAAGSIALGTVTSGGATALDAAGGPLTVTNLNSVGTVDARGTAVTIGSSGALTFGQLQATTGAIDVATTGNLSLGTVTAPTTISLLSSAGAVAGSGPVTAGGALNASGATGVSFGSLTSGGTTTFVSTTGPITVSALTSSGTVSAIGASVNIVSPGALTFAAAQATAGDLLVRTAGNLSLAGASATGNLALTSTGGLVSATGPVNAGGRIDATGQTGIALGTATSGGTTDLFAAAGPVSVTDLTSVGPVSARGTSVAIGSSGGLSFAELTATSGNVAVTTALGLTVGTTSATGTLALTAGGDLATTGAVSGAGVTLAGVNVALGGTVASSGALGLTAQQLLSINAAATGTAITTTSGDIAIGSAGKLGTRGTTQTLTLGNGTSTAPIAMGGTGTAGRYSLDNAEAGRLFADNSITLAGGSSDIGVGALAMSFGSASSANIGSGGTLKIDTSGNVSVTGAVTIATSSASDTFSIDPRRIDVIAGSGSIAMTGSAGTPLGTLVLEAGTIAVASQAVIDGIANAADFASIAALLDQPGPAGPAGGYIQAGTIDVTVDDALYIQNAGTGTAYDDRRGFTAGALSIETAGEGSARISINGVILGTTGPITGLATAREVVINGSPATDYAASPFPTINGCAVNVDCARPDFPGQSRSDLEQPLSGDGTSDGGGNQNGLLLPGNGLVLLSDTEPLITPPLVDEPITGVGNDDFWQVRCEPGDDEAQCPAGDREE